MDPVDLPKCFRSIIPIVGMHFLRLMEGIRKNKCHQSYQRFKPKWKWKESCLKLLFQRLLYLIRHYIRTMPFRIFHFLHLYLVSRGMTWVRDISKSWTTIQAKSENFQIVCQVECSQSFNANQIWMELFGGHYPETETQWN